MVSFLIF